MSEEKFCCLCVTLSSAYKELFNKSGGETAFYDITFKYFDPVVCSYGPYYFSNLPNNLLL